MKLRRVPVSIQAMPLRPHRSNRRRPSPAPGFAAVLVLVVTVVVIARTDSDLADAGAIAMLLVFAGLMMGGYADRGARPPAHPWTAS